MAHRKGAGKEMKYMIVKQQNGEGCDYTIGCGISVEIIEAGSIQEAEAIALYPNGEGSKADIFEDCDGNYIKSIRIFKVSDCHEVDVEGLRKAGFSNQKKEAEEAAKASELAEFERLRQKIYGL
jgi:hypothetical protein